MSIINSQPRIGAAGQSTGFKIERSLRFNSADSAYLNRTPGSASNRKTFTWSGWVKRSSIDVASSKAFFNCGATSTTTGFVALLYSDNTITSIVKNSASTAEFISSAVWRDVSAWYHVVIAIDTTQATASNRLKVYVNNTQLTWSTSGTIDQNLDTEINNTTAFEIGAYKNSSGTRGAYFDGYMADVHFIDGQALTPSSFGETDTDTGVWKPKAYSGSYGTNGFYLKFADNSGTTSTTLGKDSSGNGNNWTPNNFSVTAGAGNDSLVDTPTPYGTDTGAGGEVRGNYCTMNPLNSQIVGVALLENGNLTLNSTATTNWYINSKSTLAASSFSNYCEMTVTTQSNSNGLIGIGVGNSTANIATGAGSYITYRQNGEIRQYPGNTLLATNSSYTQGDVIGMTIDSTNVKFYKNNTLQGTYAHGFTGDYFVVGMAYNNGGTVVLDFNFGQRPFAYTAPSGFKALCTQNLPTPTIGATSTTRADDYFNVVTFTGTGAAGNAVAVGFQPDFVWVKDRNLAGYHHILQDAVRGANNVLYSNLTTGEYGASGFSFTSTGFTVGTGIGDINVSSSPEVAWNWKANGAGSTNTSGTITSTVSANTTAGFSIVTYTGTGSNATVGHGLGVAPAMLIVKNRSTAGTSWRVYHKNLTSASYNLYLDLTSGQDGPSSAFWNDTAPTSTVFSVGTSSGTNESTKNMVAYCFAAVAGYSAFGSYTGNGSTDGPMVFTGFRPRYIMIKRTDTSGTSWVIFDTARNLFNSSGKALWADLSDAEATYTDFDILSNGFKLRLTSSTGNASGGTYVYAAFAEVPFKYSLAR